MQIIVTGKLTRSSMFEIDNGSKGGAIWITKPNSGKNPNVLGSEIIKIRMNYEMFDQLKAKQDAGESNSPPSWKSFVISTWAAKTAAY